MLKEILELKFDTLGTVTGVINVANPHKFSTMVFPNPSASIFTFWVNNATQKANLCIYKMNGQLLFSQLLDNGSNSCNISPYANGADLYTIVNSKGEKVSGKILKQ